MAQSRLEKISTIYLRSKGLIQSGAVKWVDRPLWYDIYEAFPPVEEPRFDRSARKVPLRHIFYDEDKIRAKFHSRYKNVGTVQLQNRKTRSLTQRLIDNYRKLEAQYAGSSTHEQIYAEALEMLQGEREQKRIGGEEGFSLSSAFKDAQSRQSEINGIDLKNIFK